jgi:hypothetical protein
MDTMTNVYNNSVFTPLHEFVSLQVWAVKVDSIRTRVASAPGLCKHRFKLRYHKHASNV